MVMLTTAAPRDTTTVHIAMFEEFLNDKVTLVRASGERVRNIPAYITAKAILILDVSLGIVEGDHIERPLPNGVVESYLILDTGYCSPQFDVPARYSLKVRKGSALVPDPPASHVYHLNGPNARVNVHSHDASMNIVSGQGSAVFTDIRQAVASAGLARAEEIRLQDAIAELEAAQGQPVYLERYRAFIATAADHMTLLAPFIVPLTALIATSPTSS